MQFEVIIDPYFLTERYNGMKVPSSFKTAMSETIAFTAVFVRRIIGEMRSIASTTWRLFRWLAHGIQSLSTTAYGRAGAVLFGPVKQFVVGPLRVALLGKRRDVSLLITLISPVLALATAWWVGSTIGYETLTTWVRGTWFGTAPSLTVFLIVGSLLALGAVSAGVNSGLLPTGLIVSAPIFGASITRYSTTVTYSWGSQVVSLPNAAGVATLFALGFGIPITIGGFIIGRALSRVVRVYGGRTGPSSLVDNT